MPVELGPAVELPVSPRSPVVYPPRKRTPPPDAPHFHLDRDPAI